VRRDAKQKFKTALDQFTESLGSYTEHDGQWSIKGFIDVFQKIYTISSDTKIVSKILEIHIFPELLTFAEKNGYRIILADHQNYYPDLTFVDKDDERIKFAVDFKTTYRLPDKPGYCNGFTLGSHGAYFVDRTSKKNIQFPYSDYVAHFCLGIIYDRRLHQDIDETKIFNLSQLSSITSVISNLQLFVSEKWRIASDKPGSGKEAVQRWRQGYRSLQSSPRASSPSWCRGSAM
jgi:hypothetical protein